MLNAADGITTTYQPWQIFCALLSLMGTLEKQSAIF